MRGEIWNSLAGSQAAKANSSFDYQVRPEWSVTCLKAATTVGVVTLWKENLQNRHWKYDWMAPTETFKYVRIHPNFASRPVWCEKMFLCYFSLKAGRKDLTNRPKVLSPHPHPTVFWHVAQGFSYLVYPNSAFFRRKGAIGGLGGGGGGERTAGLFVKSFLPAFRKKKQHRNIFSSHTGRLAKFGWILTYLKISVSSYMILARSHSIILGYFCTLPLIQSPPSLITVAWAQDFVAGPSIPDPGLWGTVEEFVRTNSSPVLHTQGGREGPDHRLVRVTQYFIGMWVKMQLNLKLHSVLS